MSGPGGLPDHKEISRYPNAVNFASPLRGGRNGVLFIRPFRRLWIALSLSSLGDWLSLLALTALAATLAGGDRKSTRLNSSHVVTSRMPSSA